MGAHAFAEGVAGGAAERGGGAGGGAVPVGSGHCFCFFWGGVASVQPVGDLRREMTPEGLVVGGSGGRAGRD